MFSSRGSPRKRGTSAHSSVFGLEELPETLNDVLSNEELRGEFRKYLEARLASESLTFYEAIEEFEKIEASSPDLQTKGTEIVNQFVREQSPDWVNISAALREELVKLSETNSFTPESFSSARREISNLLSGNFLDSFRKHLQGLDSDSAPKLSFDTTLSQAYIRSHSFEELADALSENLREDEARARGVSRCDCKPPKSVASVLSRTSKNSATRGTEVGKDDFCCEKAKMRHRLRIMKQKKRQVSNFASKLTPSSIMRKGTIKQSGEKSERGGDSKSSGSRIRIFKKRGSSTRAASLWKEVETEIGDV